MKTALTYTHSNVDTIYSRLACLVLEQWPHVAVELAQGMIYDVHDLTMGLFLRYQGQRFHLSAADTGDGNASILVELIEIAKGRRPPGKDGKQPFSLVFRRLAGPDMKPVLQNMAHSDFEARNIFVTRVQYSSDPSDTDAYYEAVFN